MTKRAGKIDASSSSPKRPRKFYVNIDRDPEVQTARLELPVCMHEQQIMEAIHENDIVLITGATGTGKTTQVPQFLVEGGFGHPSSTGTKGIIGVTQPRRVAAISCAKRVAFELNTKVGDMVGYQIRHDANVSTKTRIKFGTDGVFLREVEQDLLLSKYSAIILDEVHERSLNTDLLLSFLSRTVRMRRQKQGTLGALKVVIMSATLDVDGIFSGKDALFPSPPVVKVPSRQYPITIHFARRTKDDYVEEAFRKVSKIHRRLPQGGVLVFLSGREEVERLSSRLRQEFGERKIPLAESDGVQVIMKVLPFYSLQSEHVQRRIFEPIEPNVRKVVIATNVAETSVTVPDIAYVVDSGRVKEKVYKGRGCGRLCSFEIVWVSQASAEQRAGRAGRIGPGHCYRLYSSAVYDQRFSPYRQPEILRVPADAVVLRLRALGIRHVNKFPFPTKPNEEDILAAETLLTNLGALRGENAFSMSDARTLLGVTKIGRELATLPLEPRLGRMLLSAREKPDVMPYACRLGGILSVESVLKRGDKAQQETHAKLHNRKSDVLTELAALCAAEYSGRYGRSDGALDVGCVRRMCEVIGLHAKCVLEAIAVSEQVGKIMGIPDVREVPVPPKDDVVDELLRAIVAGFGDRIARKLSRDEAASMGVIPRLMSRAFKVCGKKEAVFLPGLCSIRITGDTEFVVFAGLEEVKIRPKKSSNKTDERGETKDDYTESEEEINEIGVENNEDREKQGNTKKKDAEKDDKAEEQMERRVVMRGVSIVKREWVGEEAVGMCHFSIKRDEEPKYDSRIGAVLDAVRVHYGLERWTTGWRWMDVDSTNTMNMMVNIDDERRKKWCEAFARALVSGSVHKQLYLLPSEGHVNLCTRALIDSLRDHEIYSLKQVCCAPSALVNNIVDKVSGCCSRAQRKHVETRWRSQLEKLRSELSEGAEIVVGAVTQQNPDPDSENEI